MTYTSNDVHRKAEIIDARYRAAGRDGFRVVSTNPDGNQRRYEFAGWVYRGAGEACRALDAILYTMRDLGLTDRETKYVARAIDVARGDAEAGALLSPTERDELLRKFGGRYPAGE